MLKEGRQAAHLYLIAGGQSCHPGRGPGFPDLACPLMFRDVGMAKPPLSRLLPLTLPGDVVEIQPKLVARCALPAADNGHSRDRIAGLRRAARGAPSNCTLPWRCNK